MKTYVLKLIVQDIKKNKEYLSRAEKHVADGGTYLPYWEKRVTFLNKKIAKAELYLGKLVNEWYLKQD